MLLINLIDLAIELLESVLVLVECTLDVTEQVLENIKIASHLEDLVQFTRLRRKGSNMIHYLFILFIIKYINV